MDDRFIKHYPFDKWIPKEDMIVGKKYLCKARNFTIGTWNGQTFDYMRRKWNSVFPATELHWDDGAPHGTVKPLEVIEE